MGEKKEEIKVSTSLEEFLGLEKGTNAIEKQDNYDKIPLLDDLLKLKMSRYAWKKAMIVVKSAFKVIGSAVESYWLLLGDKDRVIRDIIVPKQSVSSAYVSVGGDEILKLKEEIINHDLKILGWGHSHANFSVFFSGTDDSNQKRVLNENNNYIIVEDYNFTKKSRKYNYSYKKSKKIKSKDRRKSYENYWNNESMSLNERKITYSQENKKEAKEDLSSNWETQYQVNRDKFKNFDNENPNSREGNEFENDPQHFGNYDDENYGAWETKIKEYNAQNLKIKYSYGSTFNIRKDNYAELIWIMENEPTKYIRKKIPIEIVDSDDIHELTQQEKEELKSFKKSIKDRFASRYSTYKTYGQYSTNNYMSSDTYQSMKHFVIGGNWKLQIPLVEDSVRIAKEIADGLENIDTAGVDVFIAPSYNALYSVGKAIAGSKLKMAGQNMYFRDSGAFTGEISADALLEAGCEYVLLGHSERRRIFGEDDAYINQKVKKALEKGLKVVLCIGESAKEREEGRLAEINTKQLEEGLADVEVEQLKNIVIAYEPVWAINNPYLNPGVEEIKAASEEEAEEAHNIVRKWLIEKYGDEVGKSFAIQYGGSMKEANCGGLLPIENITGGLIGGASTKAELFLPIIKKAAEINKSN